MNSLGVVCAILGVDLETFRLQVLLDLFNTCVFMCKYTLVLVSVQVVLKDLGYIFLEVVQALIAFAYMSQQQPNDTAIPMFYVVDAVIFEQHPERHKRIT